MLSKQLFVLAMPKGIEHRFRVSNTSKYSKTNLHKRERKIHIESIEFSIHYWVKWDYASAAKFGIKLMHDTNCMS